MQSKNEERLQLIGLWLSQTNTGKYPHVFQGLHFEEINIDGPKCWKQTRTPMLDYIPRAQWREYRNARLRWLSWLCEHQSEIHFQSGLFIVSPSPAPKRPTHDSLSRQKGIIICITRCLLGWSRGGSNWIQTTQSRHVVLFEHLYRLGVKGFPRSMKAFLNEYFLVQFHCICSISLTACQYCLHLTLLLYV